MKTMKNRIKTSYQKERIKFIFQTIIVFFLVFSIHFKGMPSMITPRIIVLILLVAIQSYTVLRNGKIRFRKKDALWVSSIIIMIMYTVLISIYRGTLANEKNPLVTEFNYLIMLVLAPYLLQRIFKNNDEFVKALTFATAIQGFIVLLSFMFPQVRSGLENIQSLDFSRYNFRIVGLGIAGAGGSIYLFCGLLANAYLLLFKSHRLKYILFYLIIFSSIALVGRTGFYSAAILSLYILSRKLIISTSNLKFHAKTFAVLSIFSVLIFAVYRYYNLNFELLSYTVRRLDEIFTDRYTFDVLANMNVPPLNSDSIIGEGVIKGYTSKGMLIWHDSGYVQRYMAIGLIMSIFSYLALFGYLLNMIKRLPKLSERRFFLYFTLLLFVIEVKEPFIFALAYPFTLVQMLKLRLSETYMSDTKNECVSKKL